MIHERTKSEASYVVGLNTADRLGFERGSRGEPYDPCPYTREDFAHCFFEGWQRGVQWRHEHMARTGLNKKKRWDRAVRGGFKGM